MLVAPRAASAWPSDVLVEVKPAGIDTREANPLPVDAAHAFPPSARLHRPSEFTQALKGTRIARGDLFVLNTPRLTEAHNTTSRPRLGLVIAKRFAPHAVTRNTIKRVLREAFRHQAGQLPARDYVFRLHAKVDQVSLTQLRRQVRLEADRLLHRARK